MVLAQKSPLGVLRSTVQLARDAEFRGKRNRVHELQNQLFSVTAPPLQTVRQLEEAIEELVDFTSLMLRPVRFTKAFALAGMRLGYAVGQPFPKYTSRSIALCPVVPPPQPRTVSANSGLRSRRCVSRLITAPFPAHRVEQRSAGTRQVILVPAFRRGRLSRNQWGFTVIRTWACSVS